MAPKKTKDGWPQFLKKHVKNGHTYYGWYDKRIGKERSLDARNDFKLAKQRVEALNAIVAQQKNEGFLNDFMNSSSDVLYKDFIESYIDSCRKREMAESTIRSRKSSINLASKFLGNMLVSKIDTPHIVKVLNFYIKQGKDRQAQSIRSALVDFFKEAKQSGVLLAAAPNPALESRNPKAKVHRARLLLDQYLEIYEHATQSKEWWIKNAIALALVTGQRREDIGLMQFKKGSDWMKAWEKWITGEDWPIHPYPYVENEVLHVVQSKTGSLIQIPLDLKLDVINLSVGDIVKQCKDRVISKYMVHHNRTRSTVLRGDHVHIDTISRRFSDMRNLTDLEWPGKTPPTFHELRSLSKREYTKQGIDTKTLLGHKTERMSETYLDPRQAEWQILNVHTKIR